MVRGPMTYGNWHLGENTDHPGNTLDLSMLLKFLHSYNVKQAARGAPTGGQTGRTCINYTGLKQVLANRIL